MFKGALIVGFAASIRNLKNAQM